MAEGAVDGVLVGAAVDGVLVGAADGAPVGKGVEPEPDPEPEP